MFIIKRQGELVTVKNKLERIINEIITAKVKCVYFVYIQNRRKLRRSFFFCFLPMDIACSMCMQSDRMGN